VLKVTKLVTPRSLIFVDRSEIATPCPQGQCLGFGTVPILDLPFCARYRAFEMALSSLSPQIESPTPLRPEGARRSSLATSHKSAAAATLVAGRPLAPGKAKTGEGPLPAYFEALFAAHGPQHWWPGRTRFEIIVGAILTQNTSWKNVQRAIANLRHARLLLPQAIRDVHPVTLAACLRPSGYFRQKTKTLKGFVGLLYAKHSGSLTRLFATPTTALRAELLGVRGIGPETADSILLYAGEHSVFVIDAYTRRILERHALAHPKSTYEELRATFESSLPPDHQLFNEFHALIVHTGKHFCRKTTPACAQCPLNPFLPGVSRITAHQSQVTSHSSLATRHSPLATSL